MFNKSAIVLRDIKIFAHHGVLPQERAVGACFYVSLRLETDLSRAVESDDLADTVSYAEVYELVKQQMAIPSALLEHVAGRIARALFTAFPTIARVHIELYKENPPMGADCGRVGVELTIEPPL